MSEAHLPLRFQHGFETVPDDEKETQEGLTETMLSISRKTFAEEGHAYRAVHAKAHGYLKAQFEVLPGLPPALAQGLFASPASYDAVLRFSTTPGDILKDNVSAPRGAALKVLGVPGARLPGSAGDTTQNYILGNSPAFQVGTAKAFLKQLKGLAATTGRAQPLKHAVSVLSRAAETGLEAVGQKSATLTTLAGQSPTHLLGDSFFSQAPLLHGEYFAKVGLFPVSDSLTALSGKSLELSGHPNAIREAIEHYFIDTSAVWELRVQLATDIDEMPVEDASVIWPETLSLYQPVARITALPQPSWSDGLRDFVEEHSAFSPWTGLAAHRPLGSIMRARQPAYVAAREYRAEANAAEVREPVALPAL